MHKWDIKNFFMYLVNNVHLVCQNTGALHTKRISTSPWWPLVNYHSILHISKREISNWCKYCGRLMQSAFFNYQVILFTFG